MLVLACLNSAMLVNAYSKNFEGIFLQIMVKIVKIFPFETS